MISMLRTPKQFWESIEASEDLNICPRGCYAPAYLHTDIEIHMRDHGVTMHYKDETTHMYWDDKKLWHVIVSASKLDAFKAAMLAVPSTHRAVIRGTGKFVIKQAS